jgi:hypothetical protein
MDGVSLEALKKLPPGKLIRTTQEKDQFGKTRDCVVWGFTDGFWGYRESLFDRNTGEYVGEV